MKTSIPHTLRRLLALTLASTLTALPAAAPAQTGAAKATPKQTPSEANFIGHILDAQTGEHIPFATVLIVGTTMGAAADAEGHFQLNHLPVRPLTLRFSAMGYETHEIAVSPQTGKTESLEVRLKPTMISLESVVVTASRTETTKRQAAGVVNVLTPLQFERMASNSLADAMQCQPGLRVEYDCQNCGLPQLRMNGLGGEYTQMLLDSRPIFSALSNVYGLEQLPPSMIERVEIIRGGGSALFGANAIGGVVNIITKEPLKNSASLGHTTSILGHNAYDFNTSLNASLVTPDYKAGVYVFGMARQRSPYDRNEDGFSEIPKLNSATLGFRAYYKPGTQSKITAEYHHIYEYRRGGDSLNRPPHEANIAETTTHHIDGGGLKYEYMSKDLHHRFNIYASAQNIDRDSYYGTHQDPNAYGNTSDVTAIAGGQYTYAFDKLWFMPAELSAGVEYKYNGLHDVILGYGRDMTQDVHLVGGYVQNEWKTEHAGILLGVRVDKHNLMKNVVASPRVNFRYEPFHWLNLRAGYSSGYRAPQAYDEDLHVASVGGEVALISLDPDLRPEYAHSATASVEFNFLENKSVQFSFLTEGFYTNLTNVFALTENGYDADGNLLLLRTNAAGAYVGGVNFELNLATKWNLSFQASYTYQQSRYTEPFVWSEDPAIAPTTKMFRSPDQYGFVSVAYAFFKGFDFSLSANFTGPMLVEHYAGYVPEDVVKTTPVFCDMGLRLSYKLKALKSLEMEFSAGIKNVLDQYQKDLDIGPLRDAGYIYGPNLPRTYFVGLKISL
ncbi:MAG: TonB-dependent receptor [Bacteroidales bacterium]|nr:TonB-dependent receptor [Bacteroidales bacterium]